MLPCRDLDRAVAFYGDVLGARLLARFPPGLAFFDLSGVRLLLERAHADQPSRAGGCVYFAVEDVRAAQASLEAAGVPFTHEAHCIFTDTGGTFGPAGEEEWLAFFEDPDGNALALAGRRRPAEPA